MPHRQRPLTAHSSRLFIPNSHGYLALALDFVEGAAAAMGFDAEDRHKIRLSVREVAVHVLNTAFERDEVGQIEVVVAPAPDGIEIKIRDKGIPHDPEASAVGEGARRYLPRQLMDEYAFRNLGPEGKETTLVKYRKSRRILEPVAGTGVEVTPAEGTASLPPLEAEVRWMRPEEAIEVCRCVYDSYGYSYAGDFIYYPERVVALNASGDLRSAVAVTPSGEVAGHFGLLNDALMPVEMAVGVVKKRYRGRGIARRLGAFLEAEARRQGLHAVYAKQVTAHAWSQKFCHDLGFVDCAFLFAHTPQTTSFRGLADELTGRHPCIVCFKLLRERGSVPLHLPPAHAEMVARLLDACGVPFVRAAVSGGGFAHERTIMEVAVQPRRDLAILHFTQFGHDFPAMMRQRLHRLRCQEVRLVEAYVSLEDPAAPLVVAMLEEQGFFFTGILPHTALGHALVMQHFNGVEIEYDIAHVTSALARDLLAYIEARAPALQ